MLRLIASLAVLVFCTNGAFASGPVSGPAGLAGPGLISIEGRTVRLWGILMPGRNTEEGAIAYRQFGQLIEGRRLYCVPTDDIVHPVADVICRTGEGRDIAELLVSEGWALDDGPRSRGYYLNEMEDAAARRRGVWGLTTRVDPTIVSDAELPELAAIPDQQAVEEVGEEIQPSEEAAGEVSAQQSPEVEATDPRPPEPAGAPPPDARLPDARPAQGAALQVAAGDSLAQRAAEEARMRSSYPWLFEGRNIRFVDPPPNAGRYRVIVYVPETELAETCARLSANREACLLLNRP